MNKLALLAASVAVLGFATPSFASDGAAQGRIQLAQAAGVSVSVGDGPRVRSGVVVATMIAAITVAIVTAIATTGAATTW